jgi:hypothetical protein
MGIEIIKSNWRSHQDLNQKAALIKEQNLFSFSCEGYNLQA